ncbi:CBS domain-containing protein CBSX2, chloroplastic-like isoform X1 [Cucumis melo]|uniref:CBS domain-containing protein CBSX2, chloroplastic-like isoform X1 n=1 Tax=Cucumis melo TaxID=3656 RepID=A0ABM3KY21_CUCME|nr:CBS domain-containing protein CBSX2, chloroplastic-like isoform X1 [Cucumis melo]
MTSISLSNSHALARPYPHHLPHSHRQQWCSRPLLSSNSLSKLHRFGISDRFPARPPLPLVLASSGAGVVDSFPLRGTYTVGDFMTRKENLYVVKPTTTVDEALEVLVEKRITGFPVVDDDWNLVIFLWRGLGKGSCSLSVSMRILQILSTLFFISSFEDLGCAYACIVKALPLSQARNFGPFMLRVGVVSDYDLLALDSISGGTQSDTNLFPDVDSSWKTFNEIQKLLSKTNGKVVGDLMTSSPLAVRETSNLEDAARLLLETKYRRLPVVDADGKLVGIITRGNVVRAALQIKRAAERST